MQDKPSQASKPKASRPPAMTKLELTPEQIADFKTLVQSGMTAAQACESMSLAYGRASKTYENMAKQARTEQQIGLYKSLWQHIQSNASAAVFAAKAKLGWQDVQKIEQIQTVEFVDLPVNESREAWQKRQQLRLVQPASKASSSG